MIRQLPAPGKFVPATKIANAIQAWHNRFSGFYGRLLYRPYYRVLYGRRFLFSGKFAGAISRLEQRQARGDAVTTRAKWESQYLQGRWDRLRKIDQVPRYSVVAGYLEFLKPGGSVLDIGCGEGLLLQRLSPEACSCYVGIDISQAAVDKATPRPDIRSCFARAEAQHYVPRAGFDAIVFNEVLYYFASPFEVVKRYESWLKPGGVFITSLYLGSARSAAIARWLKKNYESVEEARIGSDNKSWIINVLAPRAP
jgi:SAM-dependent methyltransferase